MTRSLRIAILGLSCGFLFAVALGAIRGNAHGARALLVPGAIGLGFTVLLAVVLGVRDRAARRTEERPARHAPVSTERAEPAAADAGTKEVVAAADQAAARIAVLEARLALEQEQLDAARLALAEADLLAAGGPAGAHHAALDPAPLSAEPELRERLLDTLVQIAETPRAGSATPPADATPPIEEGGRRVP